MEIQASRPTKTRAAVHLSEECVDLFRLFSEYQSRWSEDQLARFRIWVANLGVFENGHASIDYRLRDHPDVLNLITQQLDVLKINLEKLTSLVSEPLQTRIEKRATSGSESFEIDGEVFVYDSPTSEDSECSSDLEPGNEDRLTADLLEGFQIVEDTIARLNALSTAIRRSGKQSRTSKADLYEVIEYVDGIKINMTKEFQNYASAIVAREIPGAEHFLKERLTVSIARRRNRFLYWKRHDKASKIYVKKIMPSEPGKELGAGQQVSTEQAGDTNVKRPERLRDERTIMTGFTATTFDARNFQKPTTSARGSIKPTASVRWKNREEYPKPPKIGLKESHFVCPICLILSPAKEARGDMWVQHVTRDLKPYICVFDDCKAPHVVFDNFQDWIKHMKEEQMSAEWHCASARHPLLKFDSQGLFETHMRDEHPGGFIESQLPALANRNMRFASDIFASCPFCLYGQDEDDLRQPSLVRSQDELQHHVSSHLVSLAFISLPPLVSGDSSLSESDDSSREALDSRVGHFEIVDPPHFDDKSQDRNLIDSSIAPTDDWDWNFVWEFLKKRSFRKESSSNSIMERWWNTQQNPVQRQSAIVESVSQPPLTDDHGTSITRGDASKDATLESVENPVVDGVLPATVVEGGVPSVPSRTRRYYEAEQLQRQTMKDRQNMLGPEHPETLSSINNLAQALFIQGKYKEASEFYREALDGRTKVLGLGHLDTIQSLNNLAYALVYLGQLMPAEELYRQALAAGEKTLGPEHPYVLQNVHNLGGALRNQGRHKEAEKLYRQALAGREKVLGLDHPDTMQTVNNLGGTFEKMGQYTAAEGLYRRALTAREMALGPEQPDTLQSIHNLAGALRNQGRYQEAERLYRQALQGREKTLGSNHPNTLKSLNNLALALENQERYTDAEQIYRQALAMRQEVLGKDHPDTFQSIDNIGSVRLDQSDYKEAELLHRQAMEGRMRSLGLEHPDTLQSVCNLGRTLERSGRLEEAEVFYRQALKGRERLLGLEHPHTSQNAAHLASLLERQGRTDDAREVGRRLEL